MSSLATKRERIELVGNAQAFELEGGVNGHKDMTALGSHRSRGGLGQAGVGLQGFVKHLHLLPFFVGRGHKSCRQRSTRRHHAQST